MRSCPACGRLYRDDNPFCYECDSLPETRALRPRRILALSASDQVPDRLRRYEAMMRENRWSGSYRAT